MIQRGLEAFARALFALASLVIVAACGSGAVGPPPVNDPLRITIMPGSDGVPVITYSGLPTTFTITGGTGSYIVSSSNQAAIAVSGNIPGNTLTVVPNPVVAETTLSLTARDTGSTLPATVTVIVRPGTVSNMITVTPSSTACAPAICSGGDAVVATTISQGGIPLPARGVRFEVISGDVRFITSAAGQPETTALSVTTVTDEAGVARARLRALDTAPNQTAIIQVTDLGSGAFQRNTIFVAQASSTQAGFFTVPTTITFTGPDSSRCATGLSSEIFVFGGAPPYTVSNSAPTAFTTNTSVVGRSGGSVRVTTTGVCATADIGFTDAGGRTVTVTVKNQPGTADPPPQALFVAPSSVTLSACNASASATIVGGQSGPGAAFVAGSSDSSVLVTSSGRLVTVRRVAGPAPAGNQVTVTVTDGQQTATFNVVLTGTAAGTCP